MADVIVEIEQGKLCGRIAKDSNGNDYKSFQGIPYAKPPIGKLRFKDPQPPEPWTDEILDAKKERSHCFAPDFQPGVNPSGAEDCLFLNVFTSKLPKETSEKLPVMVWIHGGGFYLGSGNSELFGPEYLVAKNVVLVTINYRLGYLGFLSLKDVSCGVTGNAGLKDQTQALRWVQKNISAFGGDPNNVTIFGVSAGSASVSYQLLSPLSKGLFHKAILQSGVAMSPWASQARHDYDLVKLLGCKSTDDKEILEFLQNQKIEDILKAQKATVPVEIQPCGEICEISPNVEPNIPSAFLPDSPENILREGRFNDVPIMIGVTDADGLMMDMHFFIRFKEYAFENDLLVPRGLQEKLKSQEEIVKTVKKIKEFYKITDIKSMTDYWTDVLFAHQSQVFATEFSRKASNPVYNYLFRISVDDLKFSCKIFNWDVYEGANHGDDLPFLFKTAVAPLVTPNTPEAAGVHIMTTLWTNFAKTGNPNPTTSDPHINVEWKPFTPSDENYLEIDLKPQSKKSLFKERIQFWNNLKMVDAIVEIDQGKLCGRIAKDANGNDYKSFQGIPYAKPPIGKLRFMAPESPEPWKDAILNAKKERDHCYVPSFLPGGNTTGSEDCLFINVYTPSVKTEEKLPVMVWIHGGGFFFGSGNSDFYGPEYLVAKNVVLVTFNYRLGYLGFLSLKDPKCGVTGNAGLKDQTQALRWVQKNISAFGGDPNNVTIFGESAGSASVSYHLLSPLSKGLFHKAILQSGVALNPWALQIRHDYEFIRVLGCNSTDDQEILEFLHSQNLEDILNAQKIIIPTEVCGEVCQVSPCIEPNIPSAFLPDSPENILREGRFNDVPIIIGVNDKDGLLIDMHFFSYDYKKYAFENNLLIPRDLFQKFESKEEIEKTIKQIKQFYKISDLKSMTDYWTDVLFAHKNQVFTNEYARKSNNPVYNYLFKISINDLKFSCKLFNWETYDGANHLDEIPYLFKMEAIPAILPNTPQAIGLHIMTTLWTNFAKTGNPNSQKPDPFITDKWKSFTNDEQNYLEIDLKPQLKKGLLQERVQFWDGLYK
ncbi:juvenile hormone esterase-like [Chrysoperla carnea]|uniref:juvenile hormone esterase-like n=1 Tax=Chrysoperla carnea TaxID=189513 RepID=UPI001D086486|nr:juvenile hormone esterase-like [Chrysoperla carnea]